MSAGEITSKAMQILEERNIECWRQNNIPVRGRAFTGRRGIGDVVGFHRMTGVMVSCEIKKIGDTLKPDQELFLTKLKAAGGLALIARQIGNEVELINY